MILITGPMYSGKRAYAKQLLDITDEAFDEKVFCPLDTLVGNTTDIESLVAQAKSYEAVILPEMGSGVVPMDKEQNALREACGALAQALAAEADTVVRVLCGIPRLMKGTL